MTEFVWFFGASGAGKATIINKVALGQFDLPDTARTITVCRESLHLGRQDRIARLGSILDEQAGKNETLLIKGQGIDLSELRLPYRLHDQFPSLKQRIVFIYTEPQLLVERTAKRHDAYWPNPEHDFVEETAYQISAVDAVCKTLGIEPFVLDNSGPALLAGSPFTVRSTPVANHPGQRRMP